MSDDFATTCLSIGGTLEMLIHRGKVAGLSDEVDRAEFGVWSVRSGVFEE